MPPDLLLPAFALTLLANAVLIALAIRALRRGRSDSNEIGYRFPPASNPGATMPRTVPRTFAYDPEPAAVPAPAPAPDRAALPPDAVAAGTDATPVNPARIDAAPGATAATPPVAPIVAPPTTRRPRAASVAANLAPPAGARRGRRKFSLPNLDDDHEKVNRSIESFLTGGDPLPAAPTIAPAGEGSADGQTADPGATTTLPTSSPPGGSRRAATTVALIAIGGLPPAGGPSTPDDDAIAEDAVAMLERTLRSAARGSDEVHVEAGGRFRVVLHATGELAARAYLRRIRATVEPQLGAAERPLRLVVTTATALNIPVRQATAAARTRLDAALAGGHDDVDEPAEDERHPEPRAAAD